jgi:hypothetical protein
MSARAQISRDIPEHWHRRFKEADLEVELIRLLPITAAEAADAHRSGWEQLTARLTNPDVDASDLFRASVV